MQAKKHLHNLRDKAMDSLFSDFRSSVRSVLPVLPDAYKILLDGCTNFAEFDRLLGSFRVPDPALPTGLHNPLDCSNFASLGTVRVSSRQSCVPCSSASLSLRSASRGSVLITHKSYTRLPPWASASGAVGQHQPLDSSHQRYSNGFGQPASLPSCSS